MKEYKVPVFYENYGYLTVKAENEEHAVRRARAKLETMTVKDLDEVTEYLADSEGVDPEGVIEIK